MQINNLLKNCKNIHIDNKENNKIIYGKNDLILIYWINRQRKGLIWHRIRGEELPEIANPDWYFNFYTNNLKHKFIYPTAPIFYTWVECEKYPNFSLNKSDYDVDMFKFGE